MQPIRLQRPSVHALVILALSLLATLFAWRWTALQGQALERVRFDLFADEAMAQIHDRMENYDHMLLSGLSLLEASDRVEREEWRAFFGHFTLDRLYPGTQGVGLAVRVGRDQWAGHEAAVRAEGFPDYAIKPPGVRDEAYPIVFIEPFSERNQRAFGYDMFSEPVRREAMARARDTGTPALTGKVVLVQETGQDVQFGVLLYVPYYGRSHPRTVEERRRDIVSFVYAPLRMGDLTRGVLGERLSRLCVQIYDQAAHPETLLFATPDCTAGAFSSEKPLDVFGRRWIMRVQSTPALDRHIDSPLSKLILGAGAAISLLLVWAVMSMLAEHRRRVALDRALGELEVARAQAAGANAAKSRFLAAASHDLRQPLQSLGLYLHLMIGQRPCPGPVEEAAQQAYDATVGLVEAMFDAAALESGRAKPVTSRFEVAELVERIAAESRGLAALNGLTMRHRVCRAEVETDRVMLERLLRNLVNNALKYTGKGGVLISCSLARDVVRIKVADSGPGIPKDKIDLIFEDFFQLENPERDPRKGLGLGLATVARLARLLDYRLKVYTRVGLGSIFVVEVPKAREAAQAAASQVRQVAQR